MTKLISICIIKYEIVFGVIILKKISVIVPIYNVEKYLNKSLDSLVNQTLEDIEIILVNDGSTDNSQSIIDKYKSEYPDKIISLQKTNGGMSDARNYGLEFATGEYISFIDSDDYVDKNMLEAMYKKAKEKDYEIVYCNTNIVYPNNILKKQAELTTSTESLSLSDKKDLILNCYPVVWNKIYKKDFLLNVDLEEDGLFKKDVWFEDARMLYKLIPNTTSSAYVDGYFYNYIQRPKSITYTYSERLNDIITNLDNIIDYYIKNNLYDEYKDELEYTYVRYMFATYIKRLAKCKDYQIFINGYKNINKKLSDKFPNYKKNKYLQNKSPKNIYLKNFNKLFATLVYFTEKNKMN